MTDYEYILHQVRKYHFGKWDDEELWKCIDKLIGLERNELVLLYMSKWIVEEKAFKKEIFKVLYPGDKLEEREDRYKGMETNELIAEFHNTKGLDRLKIRNELKYRYLEGFGGGKNNIANAFKESPWKSDQLWIERAIRSELYLLQFCKL